MAHLQVNFMADVLSKKAPKDYVKKGLQRRSSKQITFNKILNKLANGAETSSGADL